MNQCVHRTHTPCSCGGSRVPGSLLWGEGDCKELEELWWEGSGQLSLLHRETSEGGGGKPGAQEYPGLQLSPAGTQQALRPGIPGVTRKPVAVLAAHCPSSAGCAFLVGLVSEKPGRERCREQSHGYRLCPESQGSQTSLAAAAPLQTLQTSVTAWSKRTGPSPSPKEEDLSWPSHPKVECLIWLWL